MALNRRYAVCLIAALAIGLILALKANDYVFIGSDFLSDFTAAILMRRGKSVFSGEYAAIQLGLGVREPIENWHPPILAPLFLPISYFELPTAFFLFNAASMFFYLYAFAGTLAQRKPPAVMFLIVLAVFTLWSPAFGCMALGQTSLLVAAFLIVAQKELASGRNGWAGACCGAAALLKLFPIWLVFFFLLRRKWRGAASMIYVFAVGWLAAAAAVGFDDVELYTSTIAAHNYQSSSLIPFNLSLTGLILPIFKGGQWSHPWVEQPVVGELILKALLAAVALASLAVVHLVRKSSEPKTADDSFSFFLAVSLLLAPLTWAHYLLILALPLALLLISGDRRQISAAVLCMVLFSLPMLPLTNGILSQYPDGRAPWWMLNLVKLPIIGVAIVAVIYARRLLGISREQISPDYPGISRA